MATSQVVCIKLCPTTSRAGSLGGEEVWWGFFIFVQETALRGYGITISTLHNILCGCAWCTLSDSRNGAITFSGGKKELVYAQSLMMFYEYPTSVMKLIAILVGGDFAHWQ